jgi:hypothetical protein
MIQRILLALGFLATLTDCNLQQAGGPNLNNPPQQQGGGEEPPTAAGQATEGPKMPVTVSVSIRVTCRDSVYVFYGDDPKFGSGTSSYLGGNSIQNNTRQPGDMIWITDSNRNPIGSVTVSETTREVEVSCNGISAK